LASFTKRMRGTKSDLFPIFVISPLIHVSKGDLALNFILGDGKKYKKALPLFNVQSTQVNAKNLFSKFVTPLLAKPLEGQ